MSMYMVRQYMIKAYGPNKCEKKIRAENGDLRNYQYLMCQKNGASKSSRNIVVKKSKR